MTSESHAGHNSRVFAYILASDRGKVVSQSSHSIIAFVSMSGSTLSRGNWWSFESPVVQWRVAAREYEYSGRSFEARTPRGSDTFRGSSARLPS
jgi:hypothetical protein